MIDVHLYGMIGINHSIFMCPFEHTINDNQINIYQSINQVYFQVNMYKNEQKVQFTVILVQGNHVHLKEQLTCKTNLLMFLCMHLWIWTWMYVCIYVCMYAY